MTWIWIGLLLVVVGVLLFVFMYTLNRKPSETTPTPTPPTPPIETGGSIEFKGAVGLLDTSAVSVIQNGGNYTNFDIGTQSFTVEWFQKMNTVKSSNYVFSMGLIGGSETDDFVCNIGGYDTNTGNGDINIIINNATTTIPFTNVNLTTDWNHIAIVGDAGVLKVYINGVVLGQTINGYDIPNNFLTDGANYRFYIGSYIDPNINVISDFEGLITNYRWTLGTAVYTTSPFTVPTSPLTDLSGTKLLLLVKNEQDFTADSSSVNTITAPVSENVIYNTDTPF